MNTHKYILTVWALLFLVSSGLSAQNIQLSFSQAAPTCFGYTNGTATVTATGGAAPYTVQWSNGQGGFTNYGLSAGTHTVTVTDQNGQSVSGSVNVVQPAVIQPVITPSGASCTGSGTLSVAANGGTGTILFAWSNGSNGSSIPSGNGGNFFVTATDANGCQATAVFTAPAPLDAALIVNNSPCGTLPNGSAIGATVQGGTAPFTYNWNTGSADAALQQIPAGTYTVTVRDAAGCSVVKSANVVVPPVIDVTVVTIRPACDGATGSATVSATGGTPPYRHVWSNGAIGPTATGLAPGQYYVCTFDVNNCQHDIFITIPGANGLNVNLNAQNALCTGINDGSATAIVNPAAGNYTYQWNVPNAPNANTINGLAPGTAVFVTVTETGTGCQGSASTTIGAANTLQVNIADTDIPCSGTGTGSAIATATGQSGQVTYTWTFPNNSTVTGAQISNLTSGNYSVVARDANGCSATAAAEITVLSGTNLQVDNPNVGACTPQTTLSASASSGTTLTWLDAAGNTVGTGTSIVVSTGTAVTTYRVVASNASGCTDSKTITVTPNTVTLNLSANNPETACTGAPVQWAASAATSSSVNYQWTANGLTIAGGNTANPSFSGAPGTYQITVTATTPEGCTASRTAPLNIVETPQLTVNNPGVSCEPQPTVIATTTAGATLTWFNAAGAAVSTANSVNLAPGTYRVVASFAPGGCSAERTVEVKSNATNVSFSISNTGQICDGRNANWTVVNNNPGDNLTYQWNVPTGVTAQTNGDRSILSAPTGVYAISVTAVNQFNCMAMLTAPFTVVAQPELTVDKNEVKACGAQVQLSANATNGAAITWQNATGNAIGVGSTITVPAGTAPAVYTVVASNGVGCTDSETVRVSPYPVSIRFGSTNTTLSCSNRPLDWTVQNNNPGDTLTYLWTAPSGVTFSSNSSATPTITAQPGNYSVTVTASNQHGCSTQIVAPLNVSVIPNIEVAKNNIFACKANVDVEATVTGATNIRWFDAAGNPVATGTSATLPVGNGATYTVVATNGAGCTDSETITLTPNPADISFAVNNPATSCENTVFNWSVVNNDPNDNVVYDWTAPAGVLISPANGTNPAITGPVGNFIITVTATNQYGCSTTLSAPMQVEAIGDLSGKIAANVCNGRVVTFTNDTNIAGTWSFGDGSTANTNDAVHTYTAAGNYVVHFTPTSTCITPFRREIEVKNTPAVNAAIGNTLKNCVEKAEFQFNDQTVAPAGIQSWNWTFTPGTQTSTQQNPAVVFNSEGEVRATLIVQDVNGCADTVSTTVRASIVNESVASALDFCAGGSVALNADFNNTYTYQWTAQPEDPKLVSTAANPSVSPVVPTTYSLTVKNGACQVQFSILVTPKPGTTVSLPADSRVLCDNGAATLTATAEAGATFAWATSSQFNDILSNEATLTVNPTAKNTMYYVRASKGNDCPGIDSVMVSRAPVRVEGVPVSRKICLGDQTELTVTNLNPSDVLTYSWTSGLTAIANPKVTPTAAGTTNYSVTATNAAGCTQALAFAVNTLDVAVTARTDKDTLCFGQAAQLNAEATGGTTYSYSWTPAITLTNSTIANPIAQPEESVSYTVTVTADNLCQSTATVDIFVISNQCVEPYIFIPKAFTPNGDQNNDFFIVRGVNIKDLYFVVWNRWGEKMFETEDVNSPGWDGSFNGKDLTPDSYSWYVRVTCGNGAIYTKKGDVTLLK
jgi:gliding motility-associated-like protein